MNNFTKLDSYKLLKQHYTAIKKIHLRDLFAHNPQRFRDFSLEAGDLLLDYSKNHISKETLNQLCQLASTMQLQDKIEQLFAGGTVNFTENRAALHTALRNRNGQAIYYKNKNIMPDIMTNLKKMHDISDRLRSGKWLGRSGKTITDIVNIGIGGSDLGSAMAYEALSPYTSRKLNIHFLSNVDGCHLEDLLAKLSPETTLFIIASKSFNTTDTIMNAGTVKEWLGSSQAISKHMLAVTENKQAAHNFGIQPDNILKIWKWVGGRFSLWSAMGLPLAIAIGMDHFEALLAGAYSMDSHFKSTPFARNMPIVLALLSIWYVNFFGARTQAILPYAQHLKHLPFYLQQLHMESNGKQTNQDGVVIDYMTAPVLWGQIGSNGQHAFHQLLHQSQHLIPVDFIIAINAHSQYDNHHRQLVASCFSQSQALMDGNNRQEIISKLRETGYSTKDATVLAAHKHIPGNKPSNTLLMHKLTPQCLGALLALYEHKVFVQSILWGINAFDQFGVDLGKTSSVKILAALDNEPENYSADSSTQGLIHYFQRHFNASKHDTSAGKRKLL